MAMVWIRCTLNRISIMDVQLYCCVVCRLFVFECTCFVVSTSENVHLLNEHVHIMLLAKKRLMPRIRDGHHQQLILVDPPL